VKFSPAVGAYFSGLALIVSVLAVLSPSAFPSYVPAGVATGIISTCAFLNILLNALNGGLHLFSSSQPGPLAPPDAPVVVAAQKVADLPPSATPLTISATKAAAETAVANHQP
jgi:hypothetical protein